MNSVLSKLGWLAVALGGAGAMGDHGPGHLAADLHHPDATAMTYEEFFRERQASRYGEGTGKISRCC